MITGRKQHTIPQFYLNRFVHPGWVYLRGSQRPRRVNSARKIATRDWYYSPEDPKQGPSLDHLNSIVENDAAPVLDALLSSSSPLSANSKHTFSYFVANLAVRVPPTIEETGAILLDVAERIYQKSQLIVKKRQAEGLIPRVFITEGGQNTYTPQEWEAALQTLREETKSGKPGIEATMYAASYLAPVIAKMSWVVLAAASEAFFVTSDRPVVLTDLNGSPVGAGWANSNAVATLPLSPKRFLLLYGSPLDKWGFLQASAKAVEGFNSRTISFAKEAVFSPQENPLAERWLGKASN